MNKDEYPLIANGLKNCGASSMSTLLMVLKYYADSSGVSC